MSENQIDLGGAKEYVEGCAARMLESGGVDLLDMASILNTVSIARDALVEKLQSDAGMTQRQALESADESSRLALLALVRISGGRVTPELLEKAADELVRMHHGVEMFVDGGPAVG